LLQVPKKLRHLTMVRATVLSMLASGVGACHFGEECFGPASKDWPLGAPQQELTRCCTHLKPTRDLNSRDSCSLNLLSKGHYWYGRCCGDWSFCAVPVPTTTTTTTPAPPSFGTCGFVCDIDEDCKHCGGGDGGRCAKPYADDPLLNALTATCVETSLVEPPTDPKPDYRIGVQPLQHYGDLRLVEYESFYDEVKFGIGNIYYDGMNNRLRHDWSEYLGQGKQSQVYQGDAKYYIVLKSGICIDFVMREALPNGRRVGIPTPNWLNTCANTTSNLVYVGRELVEGEWADHFACYTVASHKDRNTTIAFQNWHSLGLGTTQLGQPLRVAGSNSRPRKMPPSARLTTMFYSNVTNGPESVPDSAFKLPPGCLRVGAEQAYALAAEASVPAPASLDLRRAKQRVPRSSFRGSTLGAAMVKLNKQLLAEDQLQSRPCTLNSLHELHETQRLLFAARHQDLQSTYVEGDGRLLPYESAASLLEAQRQQRVDASSRPDLMHMMRDGLCHETVMMYAHHLSQAMREKLKAFKSLVLPLLPEHELHPAPEAGDKLANSTYGGYFDSAGCLVCHVDPRESAISV